MQQSFYDENAAVCKLQTAAFGLSQRKEGYRREAKNCSRAS